MNNAKTESTYIADGLDAEAGLALCNGNPDLYHRMLIKFADSFHDFSSKFTEAFEQGDGETAMRLAHSLRGIAGNLGAMPVHEKATTLESACLDGADDKRIKAYLYDVEQELIPLMDKLLQLKN